MEKYILTLEHKYSKDGNDYEDIEEPYIASINIGNLYEGIKYFKINAIKELCDGMIKFIEEEESGS